MSYSVCINCKQMVPAYEKYCGRCLERYPHLKQVADFWKHYAYTWDAAKELARQEIGDGVSVTCDHNDTPHPRNADCRNARLA